MQPDQLHVPAFFCTVVICGNNTPLEISGCFGDFGGRQMCIRRLFWCFFVLDA